MNNWFKTVKTKKNHQCFGCAGIIPKGSRAHRNEVVDSGTWFRTYLCDVCQDIINEYRIEPQSTGF